MAKIKENPAIVRVRDTFLANETAYIVMDFVDGITLKERVMEKGLMTGPECLGTLLPMMEGLEKVHRQGMIHRDISPDNIMIEPDAMERLYLRQELQFPPSLSGKIVQTLKDGLAVRMESRIKSVGELLQRLKEGSSPAFAETPSKEKPDYRARQDAVFGRGQSVKAGTGEMQMAQIQDFVFEVSGNGDGIIIKRYKGSLQRFSIPERINGLPVTKIDDYTFAFYDCANFISIKIPSSVSAIGNHAFQNCVNLSDINIHPSEVSAIAPLGTVEA